MKKPDSRHKIFNSLIAFLVLASILTLTPGQPVHADTPAQAPAKYLVLIVIDSCRPDYLTLVPTPNLDKLRAEGTNYTNSWVGQLCNDTPPAQTTISTGRFGKNNGIISFSWREPRIYPSFWEAKTALSNAIMAVTGAMHMTDFGLWYQQNVVRKATEENWATSWENVVGGLFTSMIKDSGSTDIGALYKKAHPDAKVAAISCDKWYACAGLAATSADYTAFAYGKGVPPSAFNAIKLIKPAGLDAAPPPDYIMNDPNFVRNVTDERDGDTWATDVALAMIEKTKPEILLINLPGIDDAGHGNGGIAAPDKMAPVIANVDKQIGRIVDAYKQSGRYDETLFVIMSDHGMTPYTRIVDQSKIDRLIVEAGTYGTAMSRTWLVNQAKSKDVAEKIVGAHIPGVHGAYYKVQLADGTYAYEPAGDTATKITGDVEKAYRYLLSTFTGAKGPDVEMIIAENAHVSFSWFQMAQYKAQHDSASWLQQRTIFFITGPGVKKDATSDSPARLVDIAPTVLTLMGVAPEKMDGIVLADALVVPTDTQIRVQNKTNGELAPLVDGLKALSAADLSELEHQ